MVALAGMILVHDTPEPHSEFPIWIVIVAVVLVIAAGLFFFLRRRK